MFTDIIEKLGQILSEVEALDDWVNFYEVYDLVEDCKEKIEKKEKQIQCSFDHDRLLEFGSNYCNQCGLKIRK